MNMSFTDKVVLVTGASSDIGAAIAIKFAEYGANVTIIGKDNDKLQSVSEQCANNGRCPMTFDVDITKDEDVQKVMNETIKHFGKLDVLVNNVGIGCTASILSENAMDTFDLAMATNLRSAVYMTNLAAPHLVKSKGNIVNISSVSSMTPFVTGGFSYAVSKAGLDHFTKCVALELASNGVRVNSVNPGPVKTNIMVHSGILKKYEEVVWNTKKKGTALDRISEPQEIADVVLFLASEKAKGITGSIYLSDNGALLKGIIEIP